MRIFKAVNVERREVVGDDGKVREVITTTRTESLNVSRTIIRLTEKLRRKVCKVFKG